MSIRYYVNDSTYYDNVRVGSEMNYVIPENTNNYLSVLENGLQLPENPYSRISETWDLPPAPITYNNWGSYSSGMHLSVSHRAIYGPEQYRDPAVLETLALSTRKLNIKMRDSDFSLGVTLAEARKTSQLFSSTAIRLANSYKTLRRGNVSEFLKLLGASVPSHKTKKMQNRLRYPKNASDTPSNIWLEANYAWRPLLHDAHSSGQALAIIANSRLDDVIYRSGASKDVNESWSEDGFLRGKYFPYQRSREEIVKATTHLNVAARVSSQSMRAISALGLDNPLTIAWEVIPLSFVADWFIPIGPYLQGLATPSGFAFTSGTQGTRVYRHSFASASGAISAWGWNAGTTLDGAAVQRYEEDSYQRKPLTGFPSTTYVPPSFKSLEKALDLKKLFTSLALLDVFRR